MNESIVFSSIFFIAIITVVWLIIFFLSIIATRWQWLNIVSVLEHRWINTMMLTILILAFNAFLYSSDSNWQSNLIFSVLSFSFLIIFIFLNHFMFTKGVKRYFDKRKAKVLYKGHNLDSIFIPENKNKNIILKTVEQERFLVPFVENINDIDDLKIIKKNPKMPLKEPVKPEESERVYNAY